MVLCNEMTRLLDNGHTDAWYEYAIGAAATRLPITAIWAESDEWAEIDSPPDLPAAEALVARTG